MKHPRPEKFIGLMYYHEGGPTYRIVSIEYAPERVCFRTLPVGTDDYKECIGCLFQKDRKYFIFCDGNGERIPDEKLFFDKFAKYRERLLSV
jgi:hypothetical protein